MARAFRDKTCWVVGLGRSGCAAGALLRRHGARVVGLDDAGDDELAARWRREELASDRAFDEVLAGGADPGGALARPDLVVVSPGVPPVHPRLAARPAGVPLWGELELGARFCRATMVAITGTNGKSTTTALVAHIVGTSGRRAEALGNLGRPLSLLSEELEPDDVAVIEVSSFQLETVDAFAPRVGAVLNLAPDHLDRYDDLAAYYAAKRVMSEIVPAGGSFVTWTGCPTAMAWPLACERRLFGDLARGAVAGFDDGMLIMAGDGGPMPVVPVSELAQKSPPNLLNALSGTVLSLSVDVPLEAIREGLRSFAGLAHRHQLVAKRGTVAFVNDSKATNVHAVVSGLDGYAGRVVLIAGGSGKGEDYGPLRGAMGAVKHVVLIGREGEALGRALAGTVPLSNAVDMDEAVALAAELAAPDATVLLSPACASFDMFAGYRQRGEAFTAAALAAGAVRI